jgi:hypothetical protein
MSLISEKSEKYCLSSFREKVRKIGGNPLKYHQYCLPGFLYDEFIDIPQCASFV